MGVEQYKNTAETTLNEALDNSETGVDVVDASVFPAVPFRVKVEDELMLVTAIATNTLTVTRGIEGTSAVSHSTALAIVHVLTERGLKNSSGIREIYRAFSTTDDVHNPHETSDTDVGSLSVTFTLDEARDVKITVCILSVKSGGGSRFGIFDSSTRISPASGSDYFTDHTDADGNHLLTVSVIVNLSAASHTIKVKEQAVSNTNQVTYEDRFLMCEVLSDQ